MFEVWERDVQDEDALLDWIDRADVFMDKQATEIERLQGDRDLLVENLIAVRDAVWRTEMNKTLQRFNEDRLNEKAQP